MRRAHRRLLPSLLPSLVSAAVLALGLSACGSGDGGAGSDGTVTLTVDTFSTFGYEELFKQYEADHPGIKIKHRNVVQLDEYLPRLEQWIAAGSGAGDVVAIEEGSRSTARTAGSAGPLRRLWTRCPIGVSSRPVLTPVHRYGRCSLGRRPPSGLIAGRRSWSRESGWRPPSVTTAAASCAWASGARQCHPHRSERWRTLRSLASR
jgi:hypothetical protein